MKIFIISIILLTLLTGCTKEESIFNPQEEPTLTEEEKRNIEVINHLNDLIANSNTNRSFTYVITIDDDTYTYSGEIFENVTKGTYTHNNTTTNYQIENSKVYDSTTLEEIDIYGNINTELINITHYQISSNSYTCTMNTNTAICSESPVRATDTGAAVDAAAAGSWPVSSGSDPEWLWLEDFRAFSIV